MPGQSAPASRAAQLNGDWLWIPQRLRFAPYAQDCAVHAWPLTHSVLPAQSCAPAAPPGHAPPLVTAWHEVVATVPFSRPQHAWPVGQSQACVHPKVTAKVPVQPVALGEQLHVPWTTPPTIPVGVKQQSFERRSQVDVPQAGAVYEEHLPASAPAELLDEEPSIVASRASVDASTMPGPRQYLVPIPLHVSPLGQSAVVEQS